jgi:predicted alpha-1,2-mannosidase
MGEMAHLSRETKRSGRAAVALAALLAACGGPAHDAGPADADGDDDAADADAADADAADADDETRPDAEGDGDEPPAPRPAARPLVQWVDPFIGTGGLGFGVGAAFPGPQVPFGMARPGPDTTAPDSAPAPAHCAGYWYADVLIRGFSTTRPHGMGVPDYGAVALMPTIGMDSTKTSWPGYRSYFSHDTEEASPGYYAVTLDPAGVRVELTATARVGLHRYTFPTGADAVLLVDVGHHLAEVEIIDGRVEVDPGASEVVGFCTVNGDYSSRFGGMPVYFLMRFSRPFESSGVWKAGALFEGETERAGPDSGAWLAFDVTSDPIVEAAVGISFVDEAHARLNLDTEVPAIDFDAVREAAEAQWEDALGAAEIEGRSERDFTIFYTALYHALLMPTLATDVDGAYRGLDQEVHQAEGFTYFTDFSLWDTYRTAHPLLALLYPEWQTDMLRSLLAMAHDGGYMPRWPLGIGYTGGMVGDPADIVFADSWVKGVRGFDLRDAYDHMLTTADGPTPEGAAFSGRAGIEDYLALGYVPIEAAGASASWTLEMAHADFALAQLAEALGETADRDRFLERADSWRNLVDPATGFLLGRHADGAFPEGDDPGQWQDYYAEGNAWHYLWAVPHDLEGLADALGGPETFLARLDTFFEESNAERYLPLIPSAWYWHGNEPDLHAAWIYAALDRPDDSARWVRWVLARHYGDGPDGLPGNDDSGALSAWYVFSSIGLYPLAGLDHYLLGSPIFTHVALHLDGGDLAIEAPGSSDRSILVREISLDGVPLDRPRVPHASLPGATLHFEVE